MKLELWTSEERSGIVCGDVIYIDHGEIDDDLWDEVFTHLEKVEV